MTTADERAGLSRTDTRDRGRFRGWFYTRENITGGRIDPPVQRDDRPLGRVNPLIFEMAYVEYVAQGHGSQSAARLNERGGFSEHELISLLADALLRERGYES